MRRPAPPPKRKPNPPTIPPSQLANRNAYSDHSIITTGWSQPADAWLELTRRITVCANTLAIAHGRGRQQGISILHKGDLGAKVREAQKVLGLASRFYDDVQVHADVLASHYPTREQLDDYFRQLYPDPIDGDKTRAENTRTELFRLFEQGRGQNIETVRYSTWAALNAVTEYVDHHRPTRARTVEERATRRLQSQWFGSGAALKAKAWDLALALAT